MIQIDMEMPDCCGNCPCFHFENPMYCRAKTDEHQKITAPYRSQRPEWCPLQEVPDNGGWISVKDRLPEAGKVVLAYGKRSASTGQFQGITNKPTNWYWKGHTIRHTTHWMPLPEPPKEET